MNLTKRLIFALTPRKKRRWVVRYRSLHTGNVIPCRYCNEVPHFELAPWSSKHKGHLVAQSTAEHVAFARNYGPTARGSTWFFTERVI